MEVGEAIEIMVTGNTVTGEPGLFRIECDFRAMRSNYYGTFAMFSSEYRVIQAIRNSTAGLTPLEVVLLHPPGFNRFQNHSPFVLRTGGIDYPIQEMTINQDHSQLRPRVAIVGDSLTIRETDSDNANFGGSTGVLPHAAVIGQRVDFNTRIDRTTGLAPEHVNIRLNMNLDQFVIQSSIAAGTAIQEAVMEQLYPYKNGKWSTVGNSLESGMETVKAALWANRLDKMVLVRVRDYEGKAHFLENYIYNEIAGHEMVCRVKKAMGNHIVLMPVFKDHEKYGILIAFMEIDAVTYIKDVSDEEYAQMVEERKPRRRLILDD